MRYVYGPVPSRRLGRSLGVSPIPSKTCNYSCVYCQLGRTDHFTNERKDFFDPQEILKEIFQSVNENKSGIDYITFVGEGEPTLCKSLGYLINQAKSTHIPVAVITNGALLYDEDVRMDLKNADVVLPSLDAGCQKTFSSVNRPYKGISFEMMIDGLKKFAKMRDGQLWIEVMLVKNLNDSEEEILKIRDILKDLDADRIYINVPIRPPAEPWVEIPDEESIVKAHEILKSHVISGYETGEFNISDPTQLYDEILKICERHPMREDQIRQVCMKLNVDPDGMISKLRKDKNVKEISYQEKIFFVVKPKMEVKA